LKIQQIRELDDLELARQEKHLEGELFNLRIQNATGQLENIKRIWAVKKEIARIKTVIREKKPAQANVSSER
jgi:large subunit ribosomal protein L29